MQNQDMHNYTNSLVEGELA